MPEDDELAMYELAIDRLNSSGFEHYEVSNFARPGFRCHNNERYWANEAYYGFGVGAARYVGGVRELNTRDTRLYIRKMLAGESPTIQTEQLGPHDRALETIGTQLAPRRGDWPGAVPRTDRPGLGPPCRRAACTSREERLASR